MSAAASQAPAFSGRRLHPVDVEAALPATAVTNYRRPRNPENAARVATAVGEVDIMAEPFYPGSSSAARDRSGGVGVICLAIAATTPVSER